ncbi:hypothetical protein RQP46_006061 [Phenoliferia psychrophenolica]
MGAQRARAVPADEPFVVRTIFAWPHHKVFCGKPRQLPSYQRPTAQLLSTSPKVLRQLALLEQPTNKYDYYFIPDDSEDIAPIGVTVEDPVLAKEFRECLFTVLTGQYGNALDALMANISLTKPGAPDVIKNLMGLVFTQSKRHGHALGMVHGLARAVADDGRVFALDAWKKQLEEEHGFPIDMNPLSAAGGADGSSDA